MSKVYHGSDCIIEKPIHNANENSNRDFSWGFYCTTKYEQAERWAIYKSRYGELGYVNIYEYKKPSNLKILCFEKETEDWLDFIVSCREGNLHDYDIVEGPLGDDKFWKFISKYRQGQLSKEELLQKALFRHRETHQICFCTPDAIKCLKFIGFEEA